MYYWSQPATTPQIAPSQVLTYLQEYYDFLNRIMIILWDILRQENHFYFEEEEGGRRRRRQITKDQSGNETIVLDDVQYFFASTFTFVNFEPTSLWCAFHPAAKGSNP